MTDTTERYSHYAKKDDIALSLNSGVKATALCGVQWTPRRMRDRPTCPNCQAIVDGLNSAKEKQLPSSP